MLKYKKKKRQHRLTASHKQRRIEWAKEYVTWKDQWRCVIFSDEKKFNLDGPDGWAYYWHDLRRDKEIFSKRQQGGKSLMVWGGFGYGGKASLEFPTGRMNAIHYQTLLEEYLIPVAERIGTKNWIFQ